MHSWARFRSLTSSERRTVLLAAAALVVSWAALRISSFCVWQDLLRRTIPREVPDSFPQEPAKDWPVIQALARLEAAAARHAFLDFNCLERSLVLWWLLRCHGIPAELRLGARKEQTLFEAHAWVEFNHKAINDTSGTHDEFTPFERPVGSTEAGLA